MADLEDAIPSFNKIGSTKDLGQFIQRCRAFPKMTQLDISGLANTGNRFIVKLEGGKETVQLKKVLDVLDTLGLEMLIQRKGGN